jgi:hypothetical protein
MAAPGGLGAIHVGPDGGIGVAAGQGEGTGHSGEGRLGQQSDVGR